MEAKKLKRKYELELTIGADSFDDLVGTLRNALFSIERNGDMEYNSVMGGYSSNHVINIEVSPEQTHENYFKQVEAVLND